MPALTLTTGVAFLIEGIRCAEYYPCGSLLDEALLSAVWVPREQDFMKVGLLISLSETHEQRTATTANFQQFG
jgi:hypothetical protein